MQGGVYSVTAIVLIVYINCTSCHGLGTASSNQTTANGLQTTEDPITSSGESVTFTTGSGINNSIELISTPSSMNNPSISTLPMSNKCTDYNCHGVDPTLEESQKAIGGSEEAVNGTTDLYLLGLLGFSGAWPSGRTTLVAAQMALEQVNTRRDILPGYQLHLVWNDTKCDPGVAVDVMYHALYRKPTKIMILGAGCSIASEPTARSSHLWNLVQVSSSSASPALSDKKAYPNFLRLTSPDTLINPAKVALLKGYDWAKVATIHETYEVFSKVTDDFVARANDANMTVITSEIFTDNPSLQVQNLKRHDARIIVTGFYVDNAVRVFCKAFKEGITGQKYVWIVPGFFGADWWKKSYPDLDCTPEELLKATEGHFEFNFAFLNPTQEKGIAGVTSQEWRVEFDRRLGNETPAGTAEAPSAFDAIWAMALALNQTSLNLQAIGKSLEDFNYVDDVTLRLIRRNLWNITFLGVSGDVFFDENGDSPLPVVVRQQQGGILIDVGYFLPGEDEIRPIPSAPIKWAGGTPPKDATTYLRRDNLVSNTTYITIMAVAAVGVLGAILFLVFNVTFRKNRVIKMSSPVMNNIILIGCIVTYITVTLQEVSAAHVGILCKLRNLTMMIGFSLSFGSLFAKTWRVYRIFTNKTKKITLKDVQLVGIVLILVSADVIIFVVRETLDPYQVETLDFTSEVIENGDLVVIKRTYLCTCTYDLYFQGAIYTIKGLLLVFGAFLAWQTRKVSIPGLNDSQYIGLCIYNVAVLSILGVIINFVLKEVELKYIFTSGFIIFSTTMTQLIIFVPKVMRCRSLVNQVEDTATATIKTSPLPSHHARVGSDHLCVRANSKTHELLMELERTKEELNNLRQRLSNDSQLKF